MIPNVNPRGFSFAGVTAYLMHDKEADTSHRVEHSETFNLHTDDIEKASRFMAWTDKNRDAIKAECGGSASGNRASAGNVYHYSLSWFPDQKADWQEMRAAALATVERLGLDKHQFYLVSHNDTGHRHVHVVANLTNPETGKTANVYKDHDKLDRWANEYQLEHGIVCPNRAKKFEAWEQDKLAFPEKSMREQHSDTATAAFQQSDNAQAFVAALEHGGLTLARGNRRSFVVVDERGDIFNLTKLVEFEDGTKGRAKSKQIAERLEGLKAEQLELADSIASRKLTVDRDAQEIQRQKNLAEAADKAGKEKAKQLEAEEARRKDVKRREALAEKKRSWRSIQIATDKKTEASRKKWQLQEVSNELAKAKQHEQSLSGWFARMFKRKQIAEATDRVAGLEKTLAERTKRFRDDVEAFNARRPKQIQQAELKKHGLVKEQDNRPKEYTPVREQQKKSASRSKREEAAKIIEQVQELMKDEKTQGRDLDRGIER